MDAKEVEGGRDTLLHCTALSSVIFEAGNERSNATNAVHLRKMHFSVGKGGDSRLGILILTSPVHCRVWVTAATGALLSLQEKERSDADFGGKHSTGSTLLFFFGC